MLSYFYDPRLTPDVGVYSVAYRFFEVAIVFGGYFTQTLFPYIANQMGKASYFLERNKFLHYSIFLGIAASLMMYFSAEHIILLLGGVRYLDAVEPVRILSIVSGVSIIAGYYLNIAFAGGRQKELFYVSLIALICNVLLNLIFIPKFSYIGASWTTVATQIFILTGNAYLAKRVEKNIKN